MWSLHRVMGWAATALMVAIAALVVAVVAHPFAATNHPPVVAPPLLTVDIGRTPALGATVAPELFGLSVGLTAATYINPGDAGCRVLPGLTGMLGLIRIGTGTGRVTADDYDWASDANYGDDGRRRAASSGCQDTYTTGPTSQSRPAASVLRVLDRARALGATPVVVLNGEADDPQAAARLTRLIAARDGLTFARRIYWEIGSQPARWRHFGVPLALRRDNQRIICSPDGYAALVNAYTAAIAAALGDSTAPGGGTVTPRIIADAYISNATDGSWTDAVTSVDTQYYPYASPDRQPSASSQAAASIETPSLPEQDALAPQLNSLYESLTQYAGGSGLGLFVGEWDLDTNPDADNPLYDSATQGVFVARLLLTLMAHAARPHAPGGLTVPMAAWALPLYASTSSVSTQAAVIDGRQTPGLAVFGALHALASGRILIAAVPRGLNGLDALVVRRIDGRTAIVLVNSGPRAITLPLRLAGLGHTTRPLRARIVTFDGATPRGALARRAFGLGSATLSVPALSVVVVTI